MSVHPDGSHLRSRSSVHATTSEDDHDGIIALEAELARCQADLRHLRQEAAGIRGLIQRTRALAQQISALL